MARTGDCRPGRVSEPIDGHVWLGCLPTVSFASRPERLVRTHRPRAPAAHGRVAPWRPLSPRRVRCSNARSPTEHFRPPSSKSGPHTSPSGGTRSAISPSRPPLLRPARTPVFDLASLTKVLATTPLIMRMVERGGLGLDDPVAEHVPLWRDRHAGDAVTIRDLLAHCSGLPAHLPLFREHSGRRAFERAICDVATRLRAAFGVDLQRPWIHAPWIHSRRRRSPSRPVRHVDAADGGNSGRAVSSTKGVAHEGRSHRGRMNGAAGCSSEKSTTTTHGPLEAQPATPGSSAPPVGRRMRAPPASDSRRKTGRVPGADAAHVHHEAH